MAEKVIWSEDMQYAAMGKIYGTFVLEGLRYLPPNPNVHNLKPVPKKYRVACKAWLDFYYKELSDYMAQFEPEDEDSKEN